MDKRFCPYCGQRLVFRNIDGRTRGFCYDCNRVIYENPVPATAAVVLNSDRQVLLVKRGVEPKKGEWCLPGGFIELDETPEQACLRELKEETNLNAEIDWLLGVFIGSSSIYKSVLIVGFLVKNIEGQAEAGDDSEAVRFFSLEDMPPLAFRSHRQVLERALIDLDSN